MTSMYIAVRLLDPENVSEFEPDRMALASTALDSDQSRRS
jgi:hypothetical protein